MKTVAVIQARLGSTRLPGKVMSDLGGHPVLEWCVRACRAVRSIDEVWVATSTLYADDRIANWCDDRKIKCWRGSESDVLSRFVGTAEASRADVLLRHTADCPYLDPYVIGEVIRLRNDTQADYASNVDPPGFPDGLDTEVFTAWALRTAHENAKRPIERDGVTLWMMRHTRTAVMSPPWPWLKKERWVLDTREDYEFCTAIAECWPWEKGPPAMTDILSILDRNPHLRAINGHLERNERFFEALKHESAMMQAYHARWK